MRKIYKPGEIVPCSGQYRLVGPRSGDKGREVTVVKNEPFPPTPQAGYGYKLVDPTRHKK